MRSYEFQVLGKDQYRVTKIDEKYQKGDKRRHTYYLVDLKGGDMLCDCKHFYFTKRACKHIKFVLAQLAEGGGILDFSEIKKMREDES